MSETGLPHHGYAMRPYGEGDFDACVELWRRCGLLVPHNDPARDIELWRQTDSAAILLAEREREIVGSVCVGHDGHRGWLYYVAVRPDLQRRGIGRHLVREAEAWLATRGVAKVQLMVRPGNDAVTSFYQAIGYTLTPRLVLARRLDGTPAAAETPAKLETTVTYLEMRQRPLLEPVHPPSNLRIALLHAERPSVAFYRFLYETIGERWLWWERRVMSDEALAAIIADPSVEIYVLYVDGVPAGYAELDARQAEEVELAYFGLMPDFLGRGLGPYLLYSAIEIAWDHAPGRLWVNTNTLDHPKALGLYQRMGFRPYRQERRQIADPRQMGIFRR